jgi:phosphoenolpyruvate synthase/pyruvate phosphate dikinase
VLSATAYRQLMRNPVLFSLTAPLANVAAADAALPETCTALAQMRAAIMAADLPAAVVAAVAAFLAAHGLSGRPGTVRSSATAEDSAAASFAGIHQSFLNVTGPDAVCAAVKGCYASLWTPQALAYRRCMQLEDDAVAAAVVSGNIEPDEYTVDITRYPPVIETSQIGRKERVAVARPGGGTELAVAEPARASRPALTEPQIHELAFQLGRPEDRGRRDAPATDQAA